MIHLRTGKPGSGKTLRTIELAIQAVVEGREVFALNVNGLDYDFTGIKPAPFDDLSKWQELPAGSVLIVDEVQKYLQPCPPNTRQPDWIEALTRNRHYGVDLHFITQHPRLINYYVRELTNYHEHLVRIDGGMAASRVYSTEGLLNVTSRGVVKDAEFRLWKFPQSLYGVYKSAEVHTVKRYVPQRLKLLAAGAVVVALGVGVAWYAMSGLLTDEPGSVEIADNPQKSLRDDQPGMVERLLSPDAPHNAPIPARFTTAAEYAQLHTPVIDGMPWTAPAYAERPIVAEPEIYCVIFHSEPERCSCLSDQGTRIHVQPTICRTIAREGVYNPYRRGHIAAGASAGERSSPGGMFGM